MNKLAIILSVISILFLSSCAGPKPTQMDVELERYRMAAVTECYRSHTVVQPNYLDPRDQALVIMAEALANRDRPDSCAQIAGMNAHEARAKIAESQNQAFASVTGNLIKGAVAATGIIVAGDVMKESIKNSGDKTSITGDNNIGRDDLKTTTTTTMTTTHAPGRPPEGVPK